jgi:hypothetical protein
MERLGLNKSQTQTLVSLILVFFLIPYLPKQVLMLTDMLVVRLALLAGLIAVAYVNPVVAIAAFVVLAMLFIERNKIRMQTLKQAMQQSTMDSPAIASIVTPDTAPPQPPFENPEIGLHQFMPQADSGDDSFRPIAATIDEKQPLPTEGSNDGSQKAIHQLFEWVNPNLAQAP